MGNKRKFKCKSEAQKRAIRASYARRAVSSTEYTEPKIKNRSHEGESGLTDKLDFPNEFPFWARLKISKNRTTLVIDECEVKDKQHGSKLVQGFVHREATSSSDKGYEQIMPNPDKDKKEPMNLKSPRKLPKRLFKPHNKNLDMPQQLKDRYSKNNKK